MPSEGHLSLFLTNPGAPKIVIKKIYSDTKRLINVKLY